MFLLFKLSLSWNKTTDFQQCCIVKMIKFIFDKIVIRQAISIKIIAFQRLTDEFREHHANAVLSDI
jgi:hypothetical protein